ncbi:unnamed protein product [Caenorhabditis angaria]|uniref:Uncharacterized protein n=1 Tax=Caenorhabditis angaria TaxID=860376 RepID=A0A9P1I927_9PELO|nr:unnamed protein product [Caenorhabditis angaria]
MGEILERYIEQMSTTIETMRRRMIAYYDGIFFISKKVGKAVERAKEVAEPAAADAKDFVNLAISDIEPLDSIETEQKNNLVEMYLGISVMLIGFGGGQLSGVFALQSILQYFFDNYVIGLILTSIPFFVYFNVRRNISLDDNERRSMLFSYTMLFGILSGYIFGARVLSMAPSTLFVPPLLFALLFDNGIIPLPLTSINRQSFFIAFASISVFLTTLLSSIVLGYFSFAVSLFNIVHATGIFVHFQIIMQYVKDKSFLVGESQIVYLGTTIATQLLFTLIFGSNNLVKDAPENSPK